MIKCSKCGYDNPLMRLYCLQCKARLSLDQVTRNMFANTETNGKYVRYLLLIAVLIIAAGFVFALWPDKAELPAMTADELGQARGKLLKLQKGTAAEPIVFSEKEVNILFNYLLREGRRKSAPGMEPAAVSAAAVTIEPDEIIVRLNYQYGPFNLGAIPLGPFFITYTFAGAPERSPDGLRFAARNGAVGHLRLPALGRKLASKKLALVFLPFKNARGFLSGLEIIEIKKGRVAVSVARSSR
jgi:hypothetical protein